MEPGSDGICVDVETTGRKPDIHRVIALGLVEVVDGAIGRSASWLVHPGRKALEEMQPEAQEAHGIGPGDLEGKPGFGEAWAEVAAWIEACGKDARPIAHNAAFDYEFMAMEIARAGEKSHWWRSKDVWEDTWRRSRRDFGAHGGRHGLDALAQTLGVKGRTSQHHNALEDATVLARCWLGWRRPENRDLFAVAPQGQGGDGPWPKAREVAMEPGAIEGWRKWWRSKTGGDDGGK